MSDETNDIIVGIISAFIDESNQRVDNPVIRTASDGRTFAVVVIQQDCPSGVTDFSDGVAKAIFQPDKVLNSLKKGMKVRV